MTKAVRAAAFAESFRDQVLVSHEHTGSNSVSVLDNSGNLLFNYDTGSGANGAARDQEGGYYIAGNTSDTWDGTDGSTKSVWKLNVLGEVVWAYNNASSGQQEIAYDDRFDKVLVVATRTDAWEGTTGEQRTVWCLDADTGTLLWTYDTGSPTGGFIAVDSSGNWFVSGDRNSTWSGGATTACVWKLDTNGSLLASVDLGSHSTGIAVNEDGLVAVSNPATNTLWPGAGGNAANVWVLNNDLDTVLNYYDKHSGAAGAINIDWTLDGNLVVSGDVVGGVTTRLFNRSTGADVWTFDAGANTGALGVNQANQVAVGATRNTGWDGTDGTNKSVWLLNGSDGSLEWSYDPGARTVEIGVYREEGRTATTRETSLVVVSGGTVKKIAGTAISTPTDGGSALTEEYGRIAVQNAYNKVFMVDGTDSKVFDLATNAVSDWTADYGTLQTGSRLICLYRGRIVISGVVSDPNNWFMSRVGDPFDWDYSPADTAATDPVAGNNSQAGYVGDIVTALIPLNDDVMLFGGDSTIWQMTGDPAAGGAIDLVSDQTGIAFGRSWAKDPSNTLYFMGIDGIYRMVVGEQPLSLTQGRLDVDFQDIDLASNRVQLAWDFVRKQLWVVVAPVTNLSTDTTTVYVWDQRTDSWWQDSYPASMGPAVVYGYDAEQADDKSFLVGCRDGYLRRVDDSAADDDGTEVTNRVRFDTILSDNPADQIKLTEINAAMGEGSGDVDLKVYAGQTAEQLADADTPRFKRVVKSGRNGAIHQRVQAPAIAVELGQTAGQSRWALERLGVNVRATGRARRRRR
jgi:hypothetical protein